MADLRVGSFDDFFGEDDEESLLEPAGSLPPLPLEEALPPVPLETIANDSLLRKHATASSGGESFGQASSESGPGGRARGVREPESGGGFGGRASGEGQASSGRTAASAVAPSFSERVESEWRSEEAEQEEADSIEAGDSLEDLLREQEEAVEAAERAGVGPAAGDSFLEPDSFEALLESMGGSPGEEELEGGEGEEASYHAYYSDEEEEDLLQGFDLDRVLSEAIDAGASDVHISPEEWVRFTVLGSVKRQRQYKPLTGTQTQRLQQDILSAVLETTFIEDLELDTSYVIRKGEHSGRRLRLSIGKSFSEIFFVFRVIADRVPTPEELGVSEELLSWTDLPNGLVMMNGPTGTGKALRLDTRVPTPTGWTTMGELTVGSTVFDRFMRECRVTWISPVDASPKLYKLTFSDGQVVFADGNHQWLVAPRSLRHGQGKARARRQRARREAARAASEKLLELSERACESERATAEELFHLLVVEGCGAEFASAHSVYMALRYLSCPHERGRGSAPNRYPKRVALALLSHRVGSKFKSDSELATMTVEEMLSEGVTKAGGSNFAVPLVQGRGESGEHPRGEACWNFITSIEEVLEDSEDYGPVRCITVDSPDSSFLCADYIPTHNSTTLASMVKRIQLTREQKIITLERPVEFLFGDEGSGFVTQREIGKDARSFASALTSAMRQAPDIIMVGEVRNVTEVNELLRAAETGHLAISTMHTNSAAATLNRIKSLYKGDDQLRVLASLSDVARGFANQVLIKTPDGRGRFAVREVLSFTPELSKLVEEGDVASIRRYQEDMGITMEHELVRAVKEGRCTREAARYQSAYPHLFDKLMGRSG